MALARERHADRFCEIPLAPLTDEHTVQLVSSLVDGAEVPAKLLDALQQKAEGNPFFVEEVVATLIETGVLVRHARTGQFVVTRAVESISIPDNLQGLVMARVDRLDEEAKEVLKTAAVIGRRFLYRVAREVTQARQDLDRQLARLVDAELLRRDERLFEVEYLFRHALVQEVAYESLLLEQRRRLHKAVGDSIETLFSERLEEFYGLLAYHFTRAEVWSKAKAYLILAGDQAGRLAGDSEALGYYRRAFDAYERASDQTWAPRERALLEGRMGEALFRRGDHEQAEGYLQRALENLGAGRLPAGRSAVTLAIVKAAAQGAAQWLWRRLNPTTSRRDAETAGELCRIYEMMGWIHFYSNQPRTLLAAVYHLQASGLGGSRAQRPRRWRVSDASAISSHCIASRGVSIGGR